MRVKFVAILFALTTVANTSAQDDCFDYGTDYIGYDLEDGIYTPTEDAAACQVDCQITAGCEFWTWDPNYNNACWKKSAKGETRPEEALISGSKYCGDPPEPGTTPEPNPNAIRLMSYNMFGWNALSDPEKTENMYEIIRAYNPDSLGTQEDEGRAGDIAANIGSDYSVSGGGSAGHSIIYKNTVFDLNDSGYMDLTPEDKYGQRTVEYALFTHKASGQPVDHFNTHFCVCSDTVTTCCGQEGQYQSAVEVQNAMELYRRPGSQLIFTGDLNVQDGYEQSKAILYLKGQLDGAFTPFPLEDTFRTANGESSDGSTFPGQGKIDYIFARPGSTVTSAAIDRGDYGPASDHWPINAVIQV